jgi:hypothetical protein
VALVDGSLTKNPNKTRVRLWTESSFDQYRVRRNRGAADVGEAGE